MKKEPAHPTSTGMPFPGFIFEICRNGVDRMAEGSHGQIRDWIGVDWVEVEVELLSS